MLILLPVIHVAVTYAVNSEHVIDIIRCANVGLNIYVYDLMA